MTLINALGQVAGFVYIQALGYADVIGQQLQGDDGEAGGEMRIGLRNIHGKVGGIFQRIAPAGSQPHQVRAAAFNLYQIAQRLFIQRGLGSQADHQRARFH